MLETREIWHDGQAGVSWLTGTQLTSWATLDSTTALDLIEKEHQSLDVGHMLKKAAKHLRRTFWFGVLEDLDRSMEMLEWQLGHKPANKQPLIASVLE